VCVCVCVCGGMDGNQARPGHGNVGFVCLPARPCLACCTTTLDRLSHPLSHVPKRRRRAQYWLSGGQPSRRDRGTGPHRTGPDRTGQHCMKQQHPPPPPPPTYTPREPHTHTHTHTHGATANPKTHQSNPASSQSGLSPPFSLLSQKAYQQAEKGERASERAQATAFVMTPVTSSQRPGFFLVCSFYFSFCLLSLLGTVQYMYSAYTDNIGTAFFFLSFPFFPILFLSSFAFFPLWCVCLVGNEQGKARDGMERWERRGNDLQDGGWPVRNNLVDRAAGM